MVLPAAAAGGAVGGGETTRAVMSRQKARGLGVRARRKRWRSSVRVLLGHKHCLGAAAREPVHPTGAIQTVSPIRQQTPGSLTGTVSCGVGRSTSCANRSREFAILSRPCLDSIHQESCLSNLAS